VPRTHGGEPGRTHTSLDGPCYPAAKRLRRVLVTRHCLVRARPLKWPIRETARILARRVLQKRLKRVDRQKSALVTSPRCDHIVLP
jgi:hypothetical protein